MYVEKKIHFLFLEEFISLSLADYYARWGRHSPLYEMYIWCRSFNRVQIVEPLVEAIKRDLMGETDAVEVTYLELEILIEVSSTRYGDYSITIENIVMLERAEFKNLILDEIHVWHNKTAAKNLLKLAAVFYEGGIFLENTVQPVGAPFPPRVRLPKGVAFHLEPGEPPFFTENVIAAPKGSAALKQIADSHIWRYTDEYLATKDGFYLKPVCAVTGRTIVNAHDLLEEIEHGDLTKSARRRRDFFEDMIREHDETRLNEHSLIGAINRWVKHISEIERPGAFKREVEYGVRESALETLNEANDPFAPYGPIEWPRDRRCTFSRGMETKGFSRAEVTYDLLESFQRPLEYCIKRKDVYAEYYLFSFEHQFNCQLVVEGYAWADDSSKYVVI